MGKFPEEVTFQLRSEGYIGGSVGKSRIGGMHPYNLKNHTYDSTVAGGRARGRMDDTA